MTLLTNANFSSLLREFIDSKDIGESKLSSSKEVTVSCYIGTCSLLRERLLQKRKVWPMNYWPQDARCQAFGSRRPGGPLKIRNYLPERTTLFHLGIAAGAGARSHTTTTMCIDPLYTLLIYLDDISPIPSAALPPQPSFIPLSAALRPSFKT